MAKTIWPKIWIKWNFELSSPSWSFRRFCGFISKTGLVYWIIIIIWIVCTTLCCTCTSNLCVCLISVDNIMKYNLNFVESCVQCSKITWNTTNRDKKKNKIFYFYPTPASVEHFSCFSKSYGTVTLHGTGNGRGTGKQWVTLYKYIMQNCSHYTGTGNGTGTIGLHTNFSVPAPAPGSVQCDWAITWKVVLSERQCISECILQAFQASYRKTKETTGSYVPIETDVWIVLCLHSQTDSIN